MITEIKTAKACRPESPIAQGTKANSFIFTAGQLGRDPTTGRLMSGIEQQSEYALKNLKAVVEAGGGSLDSVVKITAYVSDLNHVPVFNEIFKKYFPNRPPARSCVQVSALARGALIVLEAVAVTEETQ